MLRFTRENSHLHIIINHINMTQSDNPDNNYYPVLSLCALFKKQGLNGIQTPFRFHPGCLRGLAVVCWITDHYHPGLNLGVGISEGCFIFDFASLPSEVTWPI